MDGALVVSDSALVGAGGATTTPPPPPPRLPLMRDLKNLLDAPMLLQLRPDLTMVACRHELRAVASSGRSRVISGPGLACATERQPPRMYLDQHARNASPTRGAPAWAGTKFKARVRTGSNPGTENGKLKLQTKRSEGESRDPEGKGDGGNGATGKIRGAL